MLMESRAEVIRGWPNDGARERNENVASGSLLNTGDLVIKQPDGSVALSTATATKRVGLVVRGNAPGQDASAANAVGDFSYTTPVTAMSGAAGVVTVTVATTSGMVVGSIVTIAGVTPAGYNGTFAVTGFTSTTFTYANATTAAVTVQGNSTLNRGFNNTGRAVVLWGNYIVRTTGYAAGAYVPGSPVTSTNGVFSLANGTTDPEVGFVLSVQGAVAGVSGQTAHLVINAY
jgi:hypothetical protein